VVHLFGVVEDEDSLRSAAPKCSARAVFFVLEAADGTAAIEAIRGNSPIDVLLLDVTLPGVPAREILAEAKRLWT
jgi:DNA-binding response OmpR family regulator